MRKLIAVAALALALPATTSAQEAPRGPGGRGPMLNSVEWLLKSKEEFNATAEQVSKIEEISKKFDAETAKLREEFQKVRGEMMNGGADRGTVMQKMRPIRDELQKKDEAAIEEVLKVLSAEQQATVKELLETRREEMRNRQRSGGQRPVKQ